MQLTPTRTTRLESRPPKSHLPRLNTHAGERDPATGADPARRVGARRAAAGATAHKRYRNDGGAGGEAVPQPALAVLR
eukprot:5636651-Prymnesium_polylepis.1